MTTISIKVKTTLLILGFLLAAFLVFAPYAGAQTSTPTATPTTTSTPTPTVSATTATTTPTAAETLPDAGISYPTLIAIGAAVLLITLSIALVL